jgi:hypothetical protein
MTVAEALATIERSLIPDRCGALPAVAVVRAELAAGHDRAILLYWAKADLARVTRERDDVREALREELAAADLNAGARPEVAALKARCARLEEALDSAPSPLGEVGETASRYARWFMATFGPPAERKVFDTEGKKG